MAFDSKAFLKNLTQLPGIYQMFDEAGELLYVGKAKNLKKRVSSYFRKTGLTPKTEALVERIAAVEVTITRTELEALLLEHNLIKRHLPPYNILLRDDKSYPYLFISDHEFPQVAFHRGPKKRKGQYFGPYPNSSAVRDSMAFLQKVFMVRQCEDNFYKNRSRPCLQHQIKRCKAPCVGLVEADEYAEDVRHTRMYLEGRADNLINTLQVSMDEAAEQQHYEKAAEYRDQWMALREMQAEQVIEQGRRNIDVVGAALNGDSSCVHILYVRQGKILGSRSFYPKVPLANSIADVLADFVSRYYLECADMPSEIVLSEAIEDSDTLAAALSESAGKQVQIKSQVRSHRAKWLELAAKTSQQNLQGRMAAKQTQQARMASLRETLNLDETPQRVECFDISHSSGEATVASCVVFDGNGPLKSDYRRFNIEGITAGDDYAAMEQAIKRRYKRIQSGEGKLPDILLIDGGKGQLRKANDMLQELGVQGVLVVGVAKGTTRKPGLETLILATETGEQVIDPSPSALHLIQQVRDEAHRFAITGHKQRRDKARRTSPLEGIDGVGPKRRRDLLRYFGGLREIAGASVTDLCKVPGINKKVAEAIYSALHNE